MEVQIFSREAAEKLIHTAFPSQTAVISFYDPPSKRTGEGYRPVDYGNLPESVFYVCIPDIDIEVLEDCGLTFDTYFPEAPALAAYIHQAKEKGLRILCQCEYGQSRSAACAAAILEHFYSRGICVFADYRYYPNQLVFNKLLAALRKHEEQG